MAEKSVVRDRRRSTGDFSSDVGVRIGSATPYRYVVIHVQYITYDATRLVGQRLLLTDLK